MSLQIKRTKELIAPDKLKLNVLIYGLPGTGKTLWCSTVPNIGLAACETGHGKGLLTVADKDLEYIEPTSLADFDAIAKGQVFKDKGAIGLDSLSEMVRTFIKDAALAIPRAKGESDKRRRGIPELDDYGVMGELTRRLLRNLLDSNSDKHIIVTATEKYDKADPENGQAETLIGPDLPGQMFLGATAMFDLVLRLRTRPAMRDPKDPRTKYVQRYLLTQPDGAGSIVKGRPNVGTKPLLDKEEVFDPAAGLGTFDYIYRKIVAGYVEALGKEGAPVGVVA